LSEEEVIEWSRLQRELMAEIRERLAAQQLGEAFREEDE
jgi:hypothetical protein